MIKGIKLKNVKNVFQEKLKDDINEIKTSDEIFVVTGKQRHIFIKWKNNIIQNS